MTWHRRVIATTVALATVALTACEPSTSPWQGRSDSSSGIPAKCDGWVFVHSLSGRKLKSPRPGRNGDRWTWTNDDSLLRVDNGCGSEPFVLRDSRNGHKVTCGNIR